MGAHLRHLRYFGQGRLHELCHVLKVLGLQCEEIDKLLHMVETPPLVYVKRGCGG
jgi:hypothetical protein